MKYILIILMSMITLTSLSQDSIYRYEERALTGNIMHVDTLMILYQKNDFIRDVPIDFVYGYKRDGKLSILYKEKSGPLSAIQMHDYVMGRNIGYKHHYNSLPFAVGFFSSYLYVYRNTRGLTRPPKITSLWFTAVPPLLFTFARPKADPRWSFEKRAGYQRARSERNQQASFWGAVAGTAVMFAFSFSR
jgi:hypothetical protein